MNTPTQDNPSLSQRRLGVKDLVTIGICGVLAMVINTVIGMILTPIYGFAYPVVGGVCALFSAPVYVLMSYRVAKRGTAVLFYLIIAIISARPDLRGDLVAPGSVPQRHAQRCDLHDLRNHVLDWLLPAHLPLRRHLL